MSRLLRLFLCLLVAAVPRAFAATYYVSPTGSDANDGLSPASAWQTVTPVNSLPLEGDTILFERNGLFRGTVEVRATDMTFGAYGEGTNPVISGAAPITGWEPHGGSIYAADFGQPIAHLFVDGALMTIARYPNMGWLRTDSGLDSSGFIDAELTSHPNNAPGHWEGATVRLRTFSWLLDVRTVADYDGAGTIVLDGSASFGIHDGWGYYLDGKLEELDAEGEWFQDETGRVYLYAPGGVDPDTLVVEGAVRDYGMHVFFQKHRTMVHDLTFRHQVQAGVYINQCNDVEVSSCKFEHIVYSGIHMAWNSANQRFAGNEFEDMLNYAVFWNCQEGFDIGNSVIEGNTMRDTAVVPGYGGSGQQSMAIRVLASGLTVRRNIIENVGYAGIIADRGGNLIEENYIANAMLTLNDGGGILVNSSGNVIRKNIVVGTVGETSYAGNFNGQPFPHIGMGIFTEPGFVDNVIEGNTTAHNLNSGIYVIDCPRTTVRNNVSYGNTPSQIRLQGKDTESYGCLVEGNVCYSLAANQIGLEIYGQDDFGDFLANIYGNAFGRIAVMVRDADGSNPVRYALPHWREAFPLRDQTGFEVPLVFTEYDATPTGGNRIGNGTFVDGAQQWFADRAVLHPDAEQTLLDGPSLRIEPTESTPLVSAGSSGLDADAQYRLRFSALAEGLATMRVLFFDETATPGWTILAERYFAIDPMRRDFEWVFGVPCATTTSRPFFEVQGVAPVFWLDTVSLEPVQAVPFDAEALAPLFINASGETTAIGLEGKEYLDIAGQAVTDELNLAPYSAAVLLLTATAAEGEGEGGSKSTPGCSGTTEDTGTPGCVDTVLLALVFTVLATRSRRRAYPY